MGLNVANTSIFSKLISPIKSFVRKIDSLFFSNSNQISNKEKRALHKPNNGSAFFTPTPVYHTHDKDQSDTTSLSSSLHTPANITPNTDAAAIDFGALASLTHPATDASFASTAANIFTPVVPDLGVAASSLFFM
ncbi:MAG: hypothetical protein RLZZ361_1424 [Cyanobacteriota bacterium]|jgi:hypothetical protein